jgi:hypothetical protein
LNKWEWPVHVSSSQAAYDESSSTAVGMLSMATVDLHKPAVLVVKQLRSVYRNGESETYCQFICISVCYSESLGLWTLSINMLVNKRISLLLKGRFCFVGHVENLFLHSSILKLHNI